ncbi:MAG: hypothetical protein KKB31_06800 [Nanoarchaeota archaeon]|nr:hypothetical protein [Nanoarchaeota archaeon]
MKRRYPISPNFRKALETQLGDDDKIEVTVTVSDGDGLAKLIGLMSGRLNLTPENLPEYMAKKTGHKVTADTLKDTRGICISLSKRRIFMLAEQTYVESLTPSKHYITIGDPTTWEQLH